MNTFNFAQWPVVKYGNAEKPEHDRGQWTARISAGGQNDAVICHGTSQEAVLALRKHILTLIENVQATYVKSVGTLNMGGGSMADIIVLKDGKAVALNDEYLGIFKSAKSFGNEGPPLQQLWFRDASDKAGPIKVSVVFGESACRHMADGRVTEDVLQGFNEYKFATQEIADAFLDGVEAASGFMAHQFPEDSDLKKIKRKIARQATAAQRAGK